jgi:hypothetical protein
MQMEDRCAPVSIANGADNSVLLALHFQHTSRCDDQNRAKQWITAGLTANRIILVFDPALMNII